MSEVKKFPIAVNVDGFHVEVENFIFVMALAIRGVDWAMELCSDPKYDLRGQLKDYEKRKSIYLSERQIERLEKQLEEAKENYRKLKGIEK